MNTKDLKIMNKQRTLNVSDDTIAAALVGLHAQDHPLAVTLLNQLLVNNDTASYGATVHLTGAVTYAPIITPMMARPQEWGTSEMKASVDPRNHVDLVALEQDTRKHVVDEVAKRVIRICQFPDVTGPALHDKVMRAIGDVVRVNVTFK